MRRSSTSFFRYASISVTARLPLVARSGVSTGSSALRMASDQPRSGSRSSCAMPSRLPMMPIGIAAAKSAMRSTSRRSAMSSSNASTSSDQAGLHRRDVSLRDRTDDRSSHARVQRRIVEDEARGVMLEERCRAELGAELLFLVRAEQLRIAVHRHDVLEAGQEPRSVRHRLDWACAYAKRDRSDTDRRRNPAADAPGRSAPRRHDPECRPQPCAHDSAADRARQQGVCASLFNLTVK